MIYLVYIGVSKYQVQAQSEQDAISKVQRGIGKRLCTLREYEQQKEPRAELKL